MLNPNGSCKSYKGKKGKKSPKTLCFYLGFVTFVLGNHCPSLTIAISKFA
jgi:hypothetical protein